VAGNDKGLAGDQGRLIRQKSGRSMQIRRGMEERRKLELDSDEIETVT
jgi:hypothetical protein